MFRYDVQINGLSALITGFVVAFKQLVPEHIVSFFKVISIRVKVSISFTVLNHSYICHYFFEWRRWVLGGFGCILN